MPVFFFLNGGESDGFPIRSFSMGSPTPPTSPARWCPGSFGDPTGPLYFVHQGPFKRVFFFVNSRRLGMKFVKLRITSFEKNMGWDKNAEVLDGGERRGPPQLSPTWGFTQKKRRQSYGNGPPAKMRWVTMSTPYMGDFKGWGVSPGGQAPFLGEIEGGNPPPPDPACRKGNHPNPPRFIILFPEERCTKSWYKRERKRYKINQQGPTPTTKTKDWGTPPLWGRQKKKPSSSRSLIRAWENSSPEKPKSF